VAINILQAEKMALWRSNLGLPKLLVDVTPALANECTKICFTVANQFWEGLSLLFRFGIIYTLILLLFSGANNK